MEKTSKKAASETLAGTLQRLKVRSRYGTTFPVSFIRSKKSGQVTLYLEAGKDFVDTLLSFLLLPLGTVICVLAAGIEVKPALGGVTGVSGILKSVQSNLSASDLQVDKKHLMRPRPAAIKCGCRSSGLALQMALEDASIISRPPYKPGLHGDFYTCAQCCNLFNSPIGGYCKTCSQNRSSLSRPLRQAYSVFEKEAGSTVGFVKANTTFLVTDNLEIMPLKTTKSVLVLSKLNIDSLADLESNDVTVSITQILQLLNSSLTSSNCLTEVFGKRK